MQGRGGKGVLTLQYDRRRGTLVGALIVGIDDELYAITSTGGVIRTSAREVRKAGRQTKGVRLMNLGESATLLAVARNAEDDADDPSRSADPSPSRPRARHRPRRRSPRERHDEHAGRARRPRRVATGDGGPGRGADEHGGPARSRSGAEPTRRRPAEPERRSTDPVQAATRTGSADARPAEAAGTGRRRPAQSSTAPDTAGESTPGSAGAPAGAPPPRQPGGAATGPPSGRCRARRPARRRAPAGPPTPAGGHRAAAVRPAAPTRRRPPRPGRARAAARCPVRRPRGGGSPPPWHRMPGADAAPRTGRSPRRTPSARRAACSTTGPTAYLESPGSHEAAPREPATARGRRRRLVARCAPVRNRPPRQAALQLKRLDPWSVLKLGLVLAVVLFFIWLVAVGVLYGVLDGMGVWDRLNGTYADLVSGEAPTGSPLISAGRVFGLAAVIGAINSLLFAVAVTVGAFVYNVSADLVGGIEVTLSERD